MHTLNPGIRNLLSCVLLMCGICVDGAAAGQGTRIRLHLNSPYEGTLSAGESQSFGVQLTQGQFMLAVVEQLGIDVVVRVFDPNDALVGEVDTPNGGWGPELVTILSDASGEYSIEVRTLGDAALEGSFSIAVERLRPAASTIPGRIDELLSPWDRAGSPGVAIAVVRNGEPEFLGAYGTAQLEYGIPIGIHTAFDLASVSKQFTAFAIAMLVDRGRISLDDDVQDHLPEVPDFGTPITIRHLVHHTSGLRDQFDLLAMAGWRLDDVITRDQILRLVLRQRELNFEPGSAFLYCNLGYTLLAEIVSRVTGRSFPEWIRENVFLPLGMEDTRVLDDHETTLMDRAYGYRWGRVAPYKKTVNNYAMAGPGRVFTSVADMAKWVVNLGTGEVGNPRVLEMIQTPGRLNNGRTLNYAFGLASRRHEGLRMVGHGGSSAGFSNEMVWYPDEDLSIIVLSNLAGFTPGLITRQVADMYLEGGPGPVEAHATGPGLDCDPPFEADHRDRASRRWAGEGAAEGRIAADRLGSTAVDPLNSLEEPPSARVAQLSQYSGDYYSPELGTHYTIELAGDLLRAVHVRHDPITLTPGRGDSFRGSMWFFDSVSFERSRGGEITGMRVSSQRARNVLFVKDSSLCPMGPFPLFGIRGSEGR